MNKEGGDARAINCGLSDRQATGVVPFEDPFVGRIVAVIGLAPDVALANGWNTEETSALVQTWCALGLSKEEILNAALKNTETHGAPARFAKTLTRAMATCAATKRRDAAGQSPASSVSNLVFDPARLGMENSDPRFATISAALLAFLKPRKLPKNVAAEAEAIESEADALLQVLLKSLPATGFEAMLTTVLDDLKSTVPPGHWPFRSKLMEACRSARQPREQRKPPFFANGDDRLVWEIENAEVLDEHTLYSNRLAELEVQGRVSPKKIEALQEVVHASMVTQRGVAEADAVQAKRIAKYQHFKAEYARCLADQLMIAAE